MFCIFHWIKPVSSAVFQAEGYSDGDLTLYHIFSITEFLKAENPVDFLSKANKVRIQASSVVFAHVFLLLISIISAPDHLW